MDAGKLLANFDLVIAAPGGVARVREMILQLAVRGQLVPQNTKDTHASLMFEEIKLEIGKMIEEGEIRAKKPLPTLESSELLFELPPGWVWSRLGDYCHVEMGQSPASVHYNQQGDGIPFFQGKADFGSLTATARYWCTKPTKLAQAGDVLLSVRAPVGPTNFAVEKCCIGRGLAALRPLAGVPSAYLLWTIRAFEADFVALGTGTTFVAISRKNIENFPIPVPPIAEQKRIVAKVDELMSLCDELDEKKQHRDNTHKALQSSALNTLATAATPAATSKAWIRIHDHWPILLSTPESIATLRQLILSLAFRGRLTEREDCDGVSGADVAEAARSEISTLVQSKAARKGAGLSPISPAEIPHEIPESWVWVRLGSVCIYNSGERIAGADIPPGAWLLELEDIQKTTSHLLNRVKARERKPKSTKSSFEAGDILYGKLRPYLDKVLVADESGYCTTEIIPLRPLGGIIPDFLRWAVKRPNFIAYAVKNSYGINLPRLGTTDGQNALLPIPPLAEQKCIAAKIDELMALCEALERGLAEKAEVGQRYGEAATRPQIGGGIKT